MQLYTLAEFDKMPEGWYWHPNFSFSLVRLTEITLLAYLLKVETRLLVVVGSFTPGTAQGNNFLRTERKFGLE